MAVYSFLLNYLNEWTTTNLPFTQCSLPEVAGGFTCPAAGEVTNSGSFSRHAHPDDCRKYYICLEGVAREYGCPIGTVFKIGDADGTGNCEDPEDVPGWYANNLLLKFVKYLALQTIISKNILPILSYTRQKMFS